MYKLEYFALYFEKEQMLPWLLDFSFSESKQKMHTQNYLERPFGLLSFIIPEALR